MGNWSVVEGRRGAAVLARDSKGCGGGITRFFSRATLARSAMVSVPAENAGGDSVQPIGSRVGMLTKGGSPGPLGKGVASMRAPEGVSWNW